MSFSIFSAKGILDYTHLSMALLDAYDESVERGGAVVEVYYHDEDTAAATLVACVTAK